MFPGVKFTLFQYQTCPFCCKVRAFLDYYGISYDVIEVNPVLRQQLKFSKYKKVPILVLTKDPAVKDNRLIEKSIQLNDSTLITSLITSFITCNPGLQDNLHTIGEMYPEITFASIEEGRSVTSVVNKYFLMKGDHMSDAEYKAVVNTLSEERKWREWADNVLVHTLSPNIYQTLPEAIDTFQVFSNMGDWEALFPTWERLLVIYVGAVAMYFVGKRLKKRHHLKGDVRESLFDAVKTWMKALKGKKFMGGNKPNLADLAVYGVLHSIEGTQAFSELLMATKIKRWYLAVKEACAMKYGHKEIAQLLSSSSSN
jgi:microsomal prostaglandin-E synthase 2